MSSQVTLAFLRGLAIPLFLLPCTQLLCASSLMCLSFDTFFFVCFSEVQLSFPHFPTISHLFRCCEGLKAGAPCDASSFLPLWASSF